VGSAVLTCHSRDDAIMGAREEQWLVKVIHVMARPCACAAGHMTKIIGTLEMVDTVFFAVSVHAFPSA